MTKGDMFKSEEDRSKCMCQITQTLSSTIKPAHGFQMPLIYIPEEANYYTSVNRKLPENQIFALTQFLEKKLSVIVQHNLARFKIDLQNLRKGIQYLKNEQQDLATKPI